MIYGFVPWNDVMDTIFGAEWPFPTFETFYFAESSVVFIIAAVIIGLIGKLGEERTVNAIISGAGDFLGAALIIVLARAVTVVMKDAAITDTIIHWTEDAVSGVDGTIFGPLAFIVNLPIAFLVPSSSGHAALIMPILAPLADFADVSRSIAVTAYQSASGLVNYITPTSAVVMGGLVLAKVRLRPLPALRPALRRDRRAGRLRVPGPRRGPRLMPVSRASYQERNAMTLNAASEVGKLRRVLVHRPGLEHSRLTPANAADLLFDDVIWVKQAKREHDGFVEAMRERDVEVLYAEELLTDVLGIPEARDWIVEQVLTERHVGLRLARSRREWARDRVRGRGCRLPDRRDDQGGPRGRGRAQVRRQRQRRPAGAAAAELPLPAGPVVVDLRRRHPQPDGEAGAPSGDGVHGGDLSPPPDLRRRGLQGLVRRGRDRLGPGDGRGR